MSTPPSSDRNLLFGILALQNDFISRDQLIAAMHAWVLDKARPLGDLLVAHGALEERHRQLLDALLDAHIVRHGDAARSLAALSSLREVSVALRQVNDSEVQASLDGLTPTREGPTSGTGSYGGRTVTHGRFRILRPHARGGLGEIFVAHDEELNRSVALKEIQERHADSPESRDRFLLEAEITGGLEHPGVVPVYGLGRHADGRPFYAMRFIQGDSLREAIARYHEKRSMSASERSLALRALLGRFLDVCNAIAYAHSRGVLHRDLKPGNIMLGKYGETLVVDWGLAKLIGQAEATEGALRPSVGDSALTQTGKVMGTPAFMSPEQASGRLDHLSPASDVYSLGATLYQVLTGQPPIPPGEFGSVLERVQRGDFPRPRQVQPSVPPALEAVCLKAMALRPADRYATPELLARDIERWLADEPVDVYREPPLVRAGRWMRRNRVVVAAVAVLLLLAVPLAVALAVVSDRARRQAEADRKQIEEEQARTEAARQAALAEERKAARLAERRRKISDFYEKYVLEGPRPLGKDSTFDIGLKKALDRARPEIARVFADEPEEELAVTATLGGTYLSLGEFATAETLFERAHHLAHKLYGERARPTLEVVNALGDTLCYENKLDAGEKLLDHGYRLSREVFGANDVLTHAFRHNQAFALVLRGRYAEAETILRELIPARKRFGKSEEIPLLESEFALANVLASQGKVAQAERAFQEVCARLEKSKGRDYPLTLFALEQHALTLIELGQARKAEPLLRELVERMGKMVGPEHPRTLACLHNLAFSLSKQDPHQEVEKLLRELIPVRHRVRGKDHPDNLPSEMLLAGTLSDLGHQAEARKLYRDLIGRYRKVKGPDHPDTLTATEQWAFLLARTGQARQAEPIQRDLLKQMRKVLGPEHPRTFICTHNLAYSAFLLKKYAEAEQVLRELLPVRERVAGADHPDTLTSLQLLGECLLAQKERGAAQHCYTLLVGRLAGKLGMGHPRTQEALLVLAALLLEQRRYAEAVPYLRAILDHLGSRLPADHGVVADHQVLLGFALLESGQAVEAEPLLRQALATRRKRLPESSQVAVAESLLGSALAAQKQFAAAEPLLLSGYHGLRKKQDAMGEQLQLAHERIVRLYNDWGKTEQARRWMKTNPGEVP